MHRQAAHTKPHSVAKYTPTQPPSCQSESSSHLCRLDLACQSQECPGIPANQPLPIPPTVSPLPMETQPPCCLLSRHNSSLVRLFAECPNLPREGLPLNAFISLPVNNEDRQHLPLLSPSFHVQADSKENIYTKVVRSPGTLSKAGTFLIKMSDSKRKPLFPK